MLPTAPLAGTHLRITGGHWRLVYAARAFGPQFESREAAERFVAWVEKRTGLAAEFQRADVLEKLKAEWEAER